MSKIIKTLRNNWKKTIFFSGCGLYGASYLENIYRDSLIRTAYCKEAEKYGNVTERGFHVPKRLTVFLNPAANKGKARKLFEKNAAPLLYLAGFEVKVVKTEYEGQVKQYMEVMKDTDVVLAAGGDGTLLEVITGLLRKEEQRRNTTIPIGVIPLGKTNRFANKLFAKEKSDARWLLDAAMAVVMNRTKSVDVVHFQSGEDKSAFAVSGLEWGLFRDAKKKISKYWYFGGLKHRFSYLRSALGDWPKLVTAELTYTYPCSGCCNCIPVKEPPVWRWWHIMMPPRVEVPTVDYSTIVNEDCGIQHTRSVSTVDFSLSVNQEEKSQPGVQVNIGSEELSKKEFIDEGWKRVVDNSLKEDNAETIHIASMELKPLITENKESWFTIDSEEFEAVPLKIEYLKDKINIFYGNSDIAV